jgi:hypothetical protein
VKSLVREAADKFSAGGFVRAYRGAVALELIPLFQQLFDRGH